jgi:hypothetical protein
MNLEFQVAGHDSLLPDLDEGSGLDDGGCFELVGRVGGLIRCLVTPHNFGG